MYRNKQGTLAAGTVKSNFKGIIDRFDAFSFTRSAKETPAYLKHFLYSVLAVAKQLEIPTYHLLA